MERQETRNVNYQESQVAISMCFSQKLQLIATTKFVISISTRSIPKLSGPCRLFGIWSACLKSSAFCLHEAYHKQENLFNVLPFNTGAYLDTQWVQGLLAKRSAINLGSSGGQEETEVERIYEHQEKDLNFPGGFNF